MCKDPALTYLNRFGYNVVRLPKAELRPLELLGRHNGTVERLGRLEQLISVSGRPQPSIRWNQAVSSIEGQLTNQLDFSIAAKILSSFVQALGGDVGVTGKLSQLRSLQILLSDVKSDRVDPALIGQYLDGVAIDTANPLWAPYLRGEGRLFVISEVLKTNQINLRVEEKQSQGASLDVPVLQQAVGAKVSVELKQEAGLTLQFAGAQQLVFGFKCLEIGLSDGYIELLLTPPTARTALAVHLGDISAGSEPDEPAGDEEGAAMLATDDLLDLGS